MSPHRGLWIVIAVTVAWAGIIFLDGSTESTAQFLGSVAAGAANAAAAVAGVWFVQQATLTL